MSRNPFRDVAIVAVHNTKQARRLDEFEDALMIGAVKAVLDKAGLKPTDVDGANIHGFTLGLSGLDVLTWLGGRAGWNGMQLPGIAAVVEAAQAIMTGQCSTVVLGGAQAGAHRSRAQTAPWTRPGHEFTACWGMYTAAQFALIARRHMAKFGTTAEALAEVAVSIRANGALNPDAVFYGQPVTRDDVLASRMIADPFHLLECAMTSEGGSAMILTTRARARDMDVKPIYILGAALDRQGPAYTMPPTWDAFGAIGKRAVDICFEQSGLGVKDIDFCEFYDPFVFEVIRQLELYGFCKPGEGGDFVLDGNIRIDGILPVSTNGGLMSFSHPGTVQNLQKVISAVMQLRGDHPDALTVDGAEVGLISNNGSAALICDVMLLGKEP